MKKIVFLETVITYGGARKSTVELAARLKDEYEVAIYDAYGTCKPFVDACNSFSVPLRIIHSSDNSHIISSRNPSRHLALLCGFVFHLIKLNVELRTALLEDKPDYIVVNNSKVLTYLFGRPKSCKIILFARGWFIGKQIHKTDRELYKRMVDKYVCVSEATRYAVYGSGLAPLEKIFVVHNAITQSSMAVSSVPTIGADKFKILISGGFLPTKGLHLAVDIAKDLRKQGIPFQIVITGIIYKAPLSQRYYMHVADLIESNALQDCVELVVNHTDVKEYFHWCDILVHPSDTEGLPRVLMEAMVLGKPVIANAVGGVTDYILNGYTGFITNYNNVDDYVDAIVRLYKDHSLYETVSNRAQRLILETYTPDAQLAAFKKAID